VENLTIKNNEVGARRWRYHSIIVEKQREMEREREWRVSVNERKGFTTDDDDDDDGGWWREKITGVMGVEMNDRYMTGDD